MCVLAIDYETSTVHARGFRVFNARGPTSTEPMEEYMPSATMETQYRAGRSSTGYYSIAESMVQANNGLI